MEKDTLFIVRHTAIHGGFGEDGLAQTGEIFTAGEILAGLKPEKGTDQDAQREFDRLIRLEAIEEPSPKEVREWKKAQEEAARRQAALLADLDDAQDDLADAKDDLDDAETSRDDAAAELAAKDAEIARQAQAITDLTAVVKQLKADARKAGTQATSPAAAKNAKTGGKNANPGATANPELQAQAISGNQTSPVDGEQLQEKSEGDQSGGAGADGAGNGAGADGVGAGDQNGAG